MRYQQLLEEQRYQISAFHTENYSPKRIAERIVVHRSTIYWELTRNQNKSQDYHSESAQQQAVMGADAEPPRFLHK